MQFEDALDKIQANYRKLNAHVRKYATGKYLKQSQDLLNELAKAMLCLTDPVRKREYDETLGRVFDEKEELFGRKSTLKWLSQQGHLTREQAKQVEQFADARGLTARDAVVQMKLVNPEVATQAYAAELGVSYIDLNDVLPEDGTLDRVPRDSVKRHVILPMFEDDGRVIVACVHEPTPELEEEMLLRFGVPMRAALATPRAVNQAIAKYYAAGMRDESAVAQLSGSNVKFGLSGSSNKPHIPFDKLSPEQQQQRTYLGYIIMMWSFIGSVLLDEFFLKSHLPSFLNIPYIPSVTTLIAAPLAIWWVTRVYWK